MLPGRHQRLRRWLVLLAYSGLVGAAASAALWWHSWRTVGEIFVGLGAGHSVWLVSGKGTVVVCLLNRGLRDGWIVCASDSVNSDRWRSTTLFPGAPGVKVSSMPGWFSVMLRVPWWPFILTCALTAGLSYLLSRYIVKQGAMNGHGVCNKCGYLLYGLRSRRCPECGTDFEPSKPDA